MANKMILVVDDSPTEMRLILAALKDTGFRIITAENGEIAFEMAKKEKPDLVLMDVVMPGLNGFQACRKLRDDEETHGIPVILSTTKDQESDRFWGMKQGAKGYIVKPFDSQELLDTINKLI